MSGPKILGATKDRPMLTLLIVAIPPDTEAIVHLRPIAKARPREPECVDTTGEDAGQVSLPMRETGT